MSQNEGNDLLTKRRASNVKGRLGELDFIRELESQGISCVDMTGQDYGLDVVAMLPKSPLTEHEIEANLRGGEQIDSWEMSATLVSLQVKNMATPTLTTSHLEMWNAANFRRPGSCFVVFVNDDNFQILDPADIERLSREATESRQASISPFARKRSRCSIFDRPNKGGRLGRFLSCWANLGELLMEVSAFRTALAGDGYLSEDEAISLITTTLLINHLEDDGLQQSLDSGGIDGIIREAKDLVEIINPICLDPHIFDNAEAFEQLVMQIVIDNTWADSAGREKAFNRYNRGLPRLLPGAMEECIRSYASYMMPRRPPRPASARRC